VTRGDPSVATDGPGIPGAPTVAVGRWAALLLGALAVLAAAPFVGDLGGLDPERARFVLVSLRVPRVMVGALVGATLGLVGAVYQLLFGNGLATPSTVGTTAGATLGAVAALRLGDLELGGPGIPGILAGAFVGAIAASAIAAGVAGSGRATMADVLLAGIATSLAASALSTALQATSDAQTVADAVRWSFGHLPQVGYEGVAFLAPVTAGVAAVLLRLSRRLRALGRGDEVAASQGVPVDRTRVVGIGVGSLGVAACVAWCGPIAFVGLLVPHLVRGLFGPSPAALLPGSTILGAAFLVASDTAARTALPGRELPVGVLTAALGAPTMVWIVARRR